MEEALAQPGLEAGDALGHPRVGGEILAPLLGDIFTSVQSVLLTKTSVDINLAYMDFEIKNRRISTDNLTFMGESIYITSQGYMDFDGRLNFTFQNQFRETVPEGQEEEDWQIALRNAIVRFGKLISKARLRGTIKEPEWDFEYINPLGDMIKRKFNEFLNTF